MRRGQRTKEMGKKTEEGGIRKKARRWRRREEEYEKETECRILQSSGRKHKKGMETKEKETSGDGRERVEDEGAKSNGG